MIAVCLMIHRHCKNVRADETYTRFVAKIVKLGRLIVKFVVVHEADIATGVDRNNISRKMVLLSSDIL